MNKNIQHHKYNTFSDFEQVVLPLNLGILIPEDDSVRLLSNILDTVDIRRFVSKSLRVNRYTHQSTRIMLKLLVYGYMNKAFSSRKIETLCKRDINFMWLLNGLKAPDHNTIARFRKKHSEEIEDILMQLVNSLASCKEIDFDNVFIDGTKIEANANRYSFVWRGSTEKFQIKLFTKIEKFVIDFNIKYCANLEFEQSKASLVLRTAKKALEELLRFSNINFVYGKGKHKSNLQKDYEMCNFLLEKQEKYNKYNATFNGRNSFSKTDVDSTFMRMKEDHMKNGQLKPAYNFQVAVNSGYIVGTMTSQDRNDANTLKPFLNKLSRNLRSKFQNIVADAGYESEEAYVFLVQNGYDSYIKPSNYEKRKTKAFKKQIGKRENMIYDKVSDEYTCHNSKQLVVTGQKIRKSKNQYNQIVTIYSCENCSDCSLKGECTKAKGNKVIELSKKFAELREKSFINITTKKGIQLRLNRSIQAEGVFAVIKEDYGFRKFLTRGIRNVQTEINLLAIAYNIVKLHLKIQNHKQETHLYAIE